MNKISKSYKLLFGFSDGLLGLASLFKRPVENGEFARVMPLIAFRVHELRNTEIVVRRVFKVGDTDPSFRKVDSALYYADDFARDIGCMPSDGYNLSMANSIVEAANIVRKMAETEASNAERQIRLAGPERVLA